MRRQVLIIIDDLNFCRKIKERLQNEITEVHDTIPLEQVLSVFVSQPYCLVIMEISSVDTDGILLLKALRRAKPIPILVLSSGTDSATHITLLRTGASAILEGPHDCDMGECLAYAESLMQLYLRSNTSESKCYSLAFGNELMIDPIYRQVILNGTYLELTRREFNLLYYMASHGGQVLSRKQIYQNVWNNETAFCIDETVKSCIKALRRKLGPAGKEYIQNIRGVGYRFIG